MVLTYDAYSETLEEQKKKEDKIKKLEEKYENEMKKIRDEMSQQFSQIMYAVKQNPTLANVKPEALINKKYGS